MDCPVCSAPLLIADRQGIEVDYCPKCRGVWLDRGELDKIVERAATLAAAGGGRESDRNSEQRRRLRPNEYDDRDDDDRRRRRGFLGELFDFD